MRPRVLMADDEIVEEVVDGVDDEVDELVSLFIMLTGEGAGKDGKEVDDEVTKVVEHFQRLTTLEQMRKALEGIKLSFDIRVREAVKEVRDVVREVRDVVKVAEVEVKVFLPPPEHIVALTMGNSTEKIAELEKKYDFTDVSVKLREEAKKWFQAARPTASRKYGPTIYMFYITWVKWNLTATGGKRKNYKGHLIKKRDEAAGASMN